MLQFVVVAGLFLFLMKEGSDQAPDRTEYPHSMFDCATGTEYVANNKSEHNRFASLGYVHSMSECPTPEGFDPSDYPDTMEEVWSNDDGLVKVFKIGVHYGGEGGRYEYYYVVGNADGSSFVSESQAGTTALKRKRFSTKREAIEYIERPQDNDPNDPTSPEAEPEDDEEPTPPSLPPRPDYGLGGGFTNLSTGGF